MIADTMTAEDYKRSGKERYEIEFREAWDKYAPLGAPYLFPQYLFAEPYRAWRADFAILDPRIIIEIDGAIWTSGRHTRGSGFLEDAIKLNYAASLGYRIFRFTPEMLKDPKYAVDQVAAVACGAKPPEPPKPPKKPKRVKKHYKAVVEVTDNREIDVRFKNAPLDYIVAMAAKVQALVGVDYTPIRADGFAVAPKPRAKLGKLRDAIERLVQT